MDDIELNAKVLVLENEIKNHKEIILALHKKTESFDANFKELNNLILSIAKSESDLKNGFENVKDSFRGFSKNTKDQFNSFKWFIASSFVVVGLVFTAINLFLGK